MFFDKLDRYARVGSLGKNLAVAFTYLATHDFSDTPPGRINLQGNDLYILVQEYTTKPAEQGVWEAHRRYIDVQYLVRGWERILFAPIEQMQAGDYVPEKDFLPLTGSGSSLNLPAGFFVVFYPEDAHMPGLAVDLPGPVKKVVAKITVV
jgi:YhcH/YjgK/YiaL family protein